MSPYRLLYKKPAAKEIQKLPKHIQKRLKAKLEWFIQHPDPLSLSEPLTKPADAQFRFRVGVYRILFDLEKNNIVILKVQHRRDVYR